MNIEEILIKVNHLMIGTNNQDKFLEKHLINHLNSSHLSKETSINTSLMLILKKSYKILTFKLMLFQKIWKFKESQKIFISEL